MSITLWAVIFALLLIIEIIKMELYGVCGAVGAIGGLIACAFDLATIWQILIALALTVVMVVFVRPIGYKYMKRIKKDSRIQQLVGADAVVVSTIDNSKGIGMVTINGQTWNAKSHRPNAVIKPGAVVKVVAMSKTTAIVDDKKRNRHDDDYYDE